MIFIYWLNTIPQRFISFPKLQNVTLFGNRAVEDVIISDEVILKQGGPLIQNDWYPNKKRRTPCEDTDTEGTRPRGDRGRGWNQEGESQRMSGLLQPSEAKTEAWNRFSLQACKKKPNLPTP